MNSKKIREIAVAWKEYKQPYVKRSTMAAYVLILENHIIPFFGDSDSLHEKDVQAFVLQKLKNGLERIYIIDGAEKTLHLKNGQVFGKQVFGKIE